MYNSELLFDPKKCMFENVFEFVFFTLELKVMEKNDLTHEIKWQGQIYPFTFMILQVASKIKYKRH